MEPQLSEFHEEDCRKPYNEFRHLNQRHKPMTIAMALKCKDGVVIAADRQGTYEDMTLSEIRKVYEISPRSAVGFSWNDANWVSRFIRFVRDEPESNPDSERIESALTKYRAYARREFPRGVPNHRDMFAAVLGTHDPESGQSKIYDFGSVQPLREEEERTRILVGSGVRKAEPYLKVAEFGIQVLFPEVRFERWTYLSTELVAKICYLLLLALPLQEGTVQGSQIFEVRDRAKELDPGTDLLEGQTDLMRPLFRVLKKDVPSARLLALDERWNIIPTSLKQLFAEYVKEHPEVFSDDRRAVSEVACPS